MLDKVISLLAPHACIVCGVEGSLVCTGCSQEAFEAVPDRCYRCKAVTQDAATCASCKRVSPLKYVWVRTIYRDTAKELMYQLKFARAKAAAKHIASQLHERTPPLPKDTVVTYIPTATSRIRQRGYDQTELIAKAFAAVRRLPCHSLLIRHGQARQVGSDRKHRIEQASKNYSVTNVRQIKGATVVVVDDIVTTGATIESAAKILKKAGAKQINAVIFAQKQ